MKNIMMSINPEWVNLIQTGEKITEIRKTCPCDYACEDSIYKVYIYETSSRGKGRQKVVGYFYSKIQKFDWAFSEWAYLVAPAGAEMPLSEDAAWNKAQKEGCLTEEQLNAYLSKSRDEDNYRICFWKIIDPVFYSKPVSLHSFGLKRPPQSWQYLKDAD